MNILNNPLLSKNFMYYNLKLNDKGLFYMNKSVDNKIIYPIFITNDEIEIVEFMKLPLGVLNLHDNIEEFFEVLIENPFFKTKKFRIDTSEGECRMLELFANYIYEQELDESYEKITSEYILDFFEEKSFFIKKYLQTSDLINNPKGIKYFDGKMIFSLIPDFDKYKIGKTIKYFYNEYFEDEIERDYFLLTKNNEDFLKILVEISNLV